MSNEILKNQSFKGTFGGKRPGAGRKKGGMNKATKEKKIVEEEFKQRVLNSAHKLLNSQMNLAEGCQFLYKIEQEEDEEGHVRRKKPELVTSQAEIEEYLSGDNDDPEKYFYVTTEKPDNKALDSLFDRVFGKVPQAIQGTGENGEILIKTITNDV